MKFTRYLFSLIASFVVLHAEETCSCGVESTAAVQSKDAPKRHPLKGVVVDVLVGKSALLVKHEEIPGVMKAMTMLLKVDAAALESVKKGDGLTGMLVRKPDGWWLEDVKPAAVENLNAN